MTLTDLAAIKARAEAVMTSDIRTPAWDAYRAATRPATVLALLAELDRVTRERDAGQSTIKIYDNHFSRISETLGGTDEWPDRASMFAYIYYLAQETAAALKAAESRVAQLEAELAEARTAIWQALDDMGAEGHGVCTAAKAQLRRAYGDDSDKPADERLDYPLLAALDTLIACDEMYGRPSRLRAERAALTKGDHRGTI